MTIDDIPERFRKDPNLVINNGQRHDLTLSEKQGDELAFLAFLDDKKESA